MISLEPITPDHVCERYVRWMNDPEIVRFTEARFRSWTADDLRRYIETLPPTTFMFAIVEPDYMRRDQSRHRRAHLGNIKITADMNHRTAHVGIILGERRGCGVGTEAIKQASDFAFSRGIIKLYAGVNSVNVASIKAFRRAGYQIEGRQIGQALLYDGTRDDVIMLGKQPL